MREVVEFALALKQEISNATNLRLVLRRFSTKNIVDFIIEDLVMKNATKTNRVYPSWLVKFFAFMNS